MRYGSLNAGEQGRQQPAGAGRRGLLNTRRRARYFACAACPAVGGWEEPCTEDGVLLCAGGPGETSRAQPPAASLTFVQGGQFQGDADDSNQVLGGDQGAQDGPDPDGLPLSCLDKLQGRFGE